MKKSTLLVVLLAIALLSGWIATLLPNRLPSSKIFVMGDAYASKTVSFAHRCSSFEESPEHRIINLRTRISTTKVCIIRAGSIRDIRPLSIVMGRSRMNGSPKVSVYFDAHDTERISQLFKAYRRTIVLYREDNQLSYFLSNGVGFDGEVATYQDTVEDAESAMGQLAISSNEWPKQSWNR